MSVAAALAEAHHHSAPKVGAAPNNAPRSQKTARASGKHPGVLQEPEVQGGAITVGHVAAPAPFISSPMLADAAAEAVDARTVKYLLKAALRRREEEEERKEWEMELARRDELQRGVTEALEKARAALDRGSKRRRKKRRKRRLPRSSVPRGGRARRRQRQWLVFGSPGDVLHCAVFPSFVDRPEMPCILAGMDQMDSSSGMYNAGFAGDPAPRAMFLLFVRPMMLGIMAGMHRKESCLRRSGNVFFREMTWSCSTAPCIWKSLVRAVWLRSTGLLIFPGDDSRNGFCIQLFLVRQRIHARISLWSFWKGRCIQRYAWFNSGYKFMRHTTEAGFACDLHLALCSSSHWSGP